MKRRISRHVLCKGENSHIISCVVISPEAEILCRPLDIFVNVWRTNRGVVCKRDNSYCFCYIVISPEAEILCRLCLRKFDNVW